MKKIIGILICLIFIGISVNTIISVDTRFDNPIVTITDPADGSIVNNPNINVIGNAIGMGIKRIEYDILYAGGGIYGNSFDIEPPVEYYEFSIPFEIVEGTDGNFITVTGVDIENNEGFYSITVYYEPSGDDTELPSVVISYPKDNDIFLDKEISLTGYVTDNVGIVNFTAYQIWNDEEYLIYSEVFTDSLISYEFDFVVTLKPGLNTLKVNAYDFANNKGEDIVEVTKDFECGHKTPTITDNSGNTTFFGLFVGVNYMYQNNEILGPENNARTLAAHLLEKPGWNEETINILTGDNANYHQIEDWFIWAKSNAQPGDEILFHFSGHGGNSSLRDSNLDEPGPSDPNYNYDEDIQIADGVIRDDTLRNLLSGFRDCVTINVKLDCCHAGGFQDGRMDIQNATNALGEFYGSDHINIDPACEANETTGGHPYFWNDSDADGIIDLDELISPGRPYVWSDLNSNGRYDPSDIISYWWDKDNDGVIDPNEMVGFRDLTWLGDFTKANLESLQNDSSFNHDINLDNKIPTTKADRNKDGITTLKELYEYSIDYLHNWLGGDNDNDGLIDEDGYDFEEVNGIVKELYIDNDGDGIFDEDPGPPSFAFWYDEPPIKPNKPSGPVDGKIGELYTYITSTMDPENDDVYFMFDWGNGNHSDWLGPYVSGSSCDATYTWNENGDYQIIVKSRDRCYAESEWSDPLSISMPKIKVINPFLIRFFEQHPIFLHLLEKLF